MKHCLYGKDNFIEREEYLKGLLSIRRMDRIQNAQSKELYRMRKGLDERINDGVLQWFGHV